MLGAFLTGKGFITAKESKLTNVNIGNMTFLWYIVFVAVEILQEDWAYSGLEEKV